MAAKPAFTQAGEQRASTADMYKTSPGITVNISCSTFACPHGFSVCICAQACTHSDLAPFHPRVAPIFKLGFSDLNKSLMRHGGV